MMKRALLWQKSGGVFLLAVGWAILVVGQAQAWEVPDAWSAVGTVRQWQATDAEFYRIQESALYLDESHFNVNQVKEYGKTYRYRGKLAGIGLAAWRSLAAGEQAERSAAARRELKFLVDFRSRVLNQAQDVRQTGTSGWGALISDRTVVGEALSRLYTAVNLDPGNPYVWHLYSYFATLVGDENRALLAIDGAEQALAEVPAGELKDLRAAVALDKAWLQRAAGDFAAAHASLETVAANGGKGLEARLLQGLLAAQMGDDQTAITIANELRRTPVSIFPPNLRNSGFTPEVADVSTWPKRSSSYLSDWILAYTWLREGRLDMVRSVFGSQRLDSQRPFAHRFWDEAGGIYEVTGRGQLAAQAWLQARVTLPYYPYTVYKSYTMNLANLTGRGGGLPYLLGFDSNFLAGSRLAYGAGLVAGVAAATDPVTKQKLAARALDQLEICRRFGLYAGQASVLRGQVYYLMNDLASARIEVDEALSVMDARGDIEGFSAVLRGLNRARGELAPADIANFYGQSGSSPGRWRNDADPEEALVNLRAAYEADSGDGNRRNLARFLIRNGQVAAGRKLAAVPLQGAVMTVENVRNLGTADVELLLEADRAAGETGLAQAMVAALRTGSADPWQEANVWALAGFVCLDNGLNVEGRVALERAILLDPGNHGLQVQLSLM